MSSSGVQSIWNMLIWRFWRYLQKVSLTFFQPTTIAEREEHGEIRHENQVKNIAKEYIDQVRARKGLDLNKKIVVNAEKQRTLSKKK